jgi:outer membrane protein TolC
MQKQVGDMPCLHVTAFIPAMLFFATFAPITDANAQMRPSGGGSTPPVQLPLSGKTQGGVDVQQSAPVPTGSGTRVQITVQPPYTGSVQGKEVVPDILILSLSEAVNRGLRANLGVISSNLSVQHANAQVAEARSTLLPSLGINVSENAAKVDLAAEGFSASAFGAGAGFQFPTSVGPFHYYDLHGSLQQDVVDVTAIHNLSSQRRGAEAGTLQARQAREEVVLAVTGVYLQLMADLALIDRQKAEVSYAQATYEQARAQVEVGNKAPIEANRSLVELQTEQQRLRSQEGEVKKRQIQLNRLLGLPLGTQLQPAEKLDPLTEEAPAITAALDRAWSQRKDLQAASAQLRSAEEARKAASSQRLPSVSINGTYGLQGVNPNHGTNVFQATAGLSVPLYQGGRIDADIAQADTVVRQRRAELADQHSQVESDVRNAYIDLQVASDQMVLSESNRKLATETLRQSQDRFKLGVADSVEVVNSEQSLASADNDYVSSVFSQHVARIALAHAMGEAEQFLPLLFERKSQ